MEKQSNSESIVQDWYNETYAALGDQAQRRYPNEELVRFMARHFFHVPVHSRRDISVLEVGCGTGANLRMIAQEEFDTYGLDLSEQAVTIAQLFVDKWGGVVKAGSMTKIPFGDQEFSAVVDVFSSNCLPVLEFEKCLDEIYRVLKPGGLFFSYSPGKRSDAFLNHAPAVLLDESTLDGIKRATSPFAGNNYPFRFIHPDEAAGLLDKHGFEVQYLETIERTYNGRSERFQFVVIEGRKVSGNAE